MKKKTIITAVILLLILGIAGGAIYYFATNQDENTLTALDKQWIEKNKNEVVEFSIINEIPVYNFEGTGVLLDFISSIEDVTGLEFNKLSYNLGEDMPTDYGFLLTDKINKNDITLYKSDYVVLTNNNIRYNNLEDIPSTKLGVLEADMENAKYYLKANSNISFQQYTSYDKLIELLNASSIDAILLPKMMYLNNIISNANINIAYNVSDMTKSLVLRVGNDSNLNNILSKYFKKWINDDYKDSYSTHFTNSYFTFKDVSEKDKTNFSTGKNYKYGFVSLVPYDSVVNGKLVGISNEIIKDFASLTDADITWKKYNNYSDLMKAFNNGEIDFFLDSYKKSEYKIDTYNMHTSINNEIVILSRKNNENIIKSLSSLKDLKVLTLKDSKINESLSDYNIKTNSYENISKLFKKLDDDSIVVINRDTYNIYMYSKLKDYKIDYQYNLSDQYMFVSNNKNANKVFNEYFDFYLSFIDQDKYINKVTPQMFKENLTIKFGPYVALVVLVILVLGLVTSIFSKVKKATTNKNSISKEDKIRYIDAMTSLKNRNYLNDSIEKWDNSEIYPQSIIMVDLNNIAYINDNYGHEEGDNVIKEAAGILITSQIENSEIIRTNGNEFLIYLVGYDEKQVVTYIRKLNKDFKELNHGFGAATGYSMIVDAIKTIDDAINEATLDMKNNKEESQS